jgi:hypothetical protein
MIRSTLLSPLRITLAAVLLAQGSIAWSGPGAHGPNGEHLDGATAAVNAKASPRIEAKSELFELVGTLGGGELSLLIDRFATNEPLLKAEVEVESGGLKAKARFHADIGDFSVDDPALLKKLSDPGEHALVITVLASDETDLLDGVLRVTQPVSETAHGHGEHGPGEHEDGHDRPWGRWVFGAAIVVAGLALVAWKRQPSSAFGKPGQGGQA